MTTRNYNEDEDGHCGYCDFCDNCKSTHSSLLSSTLVVADAIPAHLEFSSISRETATTLLYVAKQ